MKFKIPKPGCGCSDRGLLNMSFADTERTEVMYRLVQTRRSHLEYRLHSFRNVCTFQTVRTGSPYGLHITKTREYLSATKWSFRKAEALTFMTTIGTQDVVKQLMADGWPDVVKAVEGTQAFALTSHQSKTATTATNFPSSSGDIFLFSIHQ